VDAAELEQAREMANRLHAAAIPHELLVVPGARQAADYEQDRLGATLGFLRSAFGPDREHQGESCTASDQSLHIELSSRITSAVWPFD
jgi:hypothetical protein